MLLFEYIKKNFVHLHNFRLPRHSIMTTLRHSLNALILFNMLYNLHLRQLFDSLFIQLFDIFGSDHF